MKAIEHSSSPNYKCVVCDHTSSIPHLQELQKCAQCGFVSAHMQLTYADLKKIYSSSYFNGDEYADYLGDAAVAEKNFKRRIKRIRKELELDDRSVLELGCAHGLFGRELLNQSPTTNYCGFDPSTEAIRYAQETLELDARSDDYLEVELDKKIEVAFLWDVIEHLHDLESYFSKLSSDMQLDGTIYITTGDIDRLLPRMRAQRWRMIHPPTHLHYFSRKTLTQFLHRHNLEVVSFRYPSVSRSYHLIFYSLFLLKKNRPSKLVKWIYTKIPKSWSIRINTFDIIEIVAKKREKNLT